MQIWIGKEQEGKYKGMETMFIGTAKVSYIELSNVIDKYNHIKQLYFGAGGCTKIDYNIVKECRKKYPSKTITCEINIINFNKVPDEIKKLDIEFILTFFADNIKYINWKKKDFYQIKMQALRSKNERCLFVFQDFNNVDFVDTNLLRYNRYKDDIIVK